MRERTKYLVAGIVAYSVLNTCVSAQTGSESTPVFDTKAILQQQFNPSQLEKTGSLLMPTKSEDFNIKANPSKELLRYVDAGKKVEWSQATAELREAKRYFEAGDYEASFKYSDLAIYLNPNYAEAYFLSGASNFYLRNFYSALIDSDRLLELEPDHVLGYVLRASSNFYLGNYTAAEEDCNKALSLAPNNAYAFAVRGAVHLVSGEIGSAKSEAEKAIKLDNGIPLAHVVFAAALVHEKNYQDALKETDTSISINPKLAISYIIRGYAYMGLKQYDKASQDAKKALDITKDAAEAHTLLGRIYEAKGERHLSLREYEYALNLYLLMGNKKRADEMRTLVDSARDAG